MKKLLVFVFCVVCFSAFGQTFDGKHEKQITIPLKVINGDSSWFQQSLSAKIIADSINYTRPSKYKNYRLWTVILNRAQAYYENFLEGKMSAAEFNGLPKLYNIDTAKLFKGKLQGNRINVLTAIDSINKYVIVDANNNNSFLDDKVYIFPLANRDAKRERADVSITKYNGKNKTTFLAPVYIEPFKKAGTDKSLEISLTAGSMRLGRIQLNNKTYLIGLNNRNFGFEASNNTDYKVNIRALPVNRNDINDYSYFPYYDIDIAGSLYHIQQVTDEHMVLTFIKNSNNKGGRLNSFAPAIEMRDIVTDKPFKLDLHSGKYTIIDFWGSWCAPCIEALPLLINTHNKYASKVNFVNIALDYDKDLEKLKGIIAANKLNWPQLWVDRRNIENSVIFDYKVETYPTTILLDKNGEIIYRGIGTDGLQHIINLLDDKLREKIN